MRGFQLNKILKARFNCWANSETVSKIGATLANKLFRLGEG